MAQWAEYAQIDETDLRGAVISTGLTPEDYLVMTGEVVRKAPVPATTSPTANPAAYIAANSRYPARAVCVSRIETGNWTAYYNPTPVGREHAQGYFGWLPSTYATVTDGSGWIMDLGAEVRAFDRMLDRGRGREFYGISAGIC